jgi:hypothetical protein
MTKSTANQADDPTIADEAPIWRRIPPWHVVFDENSRRFRPSSAAFEDHPNGTPMSVLLGEEVLNSGRSPESVLTAYEDFSLVSFSAQLAREIGQGIIRKPIPDEPAHAEVFGKKTASVKKAFSRRCEWVLPPPKAGPAS